MLKVVNKVPKQQIIKQIELAGKNTNAVSSQSDNLFSLFRSKKVIRKPIPNEASFTKPLRLLLKKFDKGTIKPSEISKLDKMIKKEGAKGLIERSTFFSPGNEIRPSRFGFNKDKSNLGDYLTFRKPKPQILIGKFKVQNFPKDFKLILKKLKNKESLTSSENNRLLNFQLKKSGRLKPLGFITREKEITVAPTEILKKVQKRGVTLINGKKVPIYEVSIYKPVGKIKFLLKKLEKGKATKSEIKFLDKKLSKKTGFKYSFSDNPSESRYIGPYNLIEKSQKLLEYSPSGKVSRIKYGSKYSPSGKVSRIKYGSKYSPSGKVSRIKYGSKYPSSAKFYKKKRFVLNSKKRLNPSSSRFLKVSRGKKFLYKKPLSILSKTSSPIKTSKYSSSKYSYSPSSKYSPSKYSSSPPSKYSYSPYKRILPRIPPRPLLHLRSNPSISKNKILFPRAYNVYGKSGKRFIRLNKIPLSPKDAIAKGRYVIDNTVSASFKLKPVGKVNKLGKIPKHELSYSRRVKSKFRDYKIKRGKRRASEIIIEKRGYRIDTRGEKRGLTIAKYLKQSLNKKRLKGGRKK